MFGMLGTIFSLKGLEKVTKNDGGDSAGGENEFMTPARVRIFATVIY